MAEQQKSEDQERVAGQSPALGVELLAQLRDLIPQAFSNGSVDFNKLRELLGDEIDDRPERFSFTWAGRRDAIAMLQAPTSATLVPDFDNSVGFEDASHAFIEGEN